MKVVKYRLRTEKSEVIDEVNNRSEFVKLVRSLEDDHIFPDLCTGYAYDEDGNEVYDPNYPNTFDFVDYKYTLED